MSEFLLDLLGIPKVRYQRGQGKALLSFNELARAFVVDRDFSYTEILSQMYPEPRKETIKMMLGLTTQEIADVEEEITELQARILRLGDEIRGIEHLLVDFNVGSLIEIQERRNYLQKSLDDIQSEEDALRQRIEQAATLPSQGGSYRAEEYQNLSEELVAKREQLGSIQSELATIARQLQEKTELKAILEADVQRFERHSSSQFVLSTFTFSRCPRCLRPIVPEMRAREIEKECMLCGRPLEYETEIDSGAWEKSLADAKKAVQEADQLLHYYAERIGFLEKQKNAIRARIEWVQAELARQTARYVSPLVEDLSLVNERRAQVLKGLSEIELGERQRQYVNNLRDEGLQTLKRQREELQTRLDELQLKRGKRGEREQAFLMHFVYFMRSTASNQFREASFDQGELLPKINGQEHTRAMTGFDLAISVLAFHYSLLAMKVKPPNFDTEHPGILIVDEPQQQMMERVQYQRIMQLLSELASGYSENTQIIVAATQISGFENFLRPITTHPK